MQRGATPARTRMMSSEDDLLKCIQAVLEGDKERFEAVVLATEKPLFNFVLNRVKDGELARDLSQEAYLRVFRALAHFDHRRSSFKTWLLRIALSLCTDHFRRQKTARDVELELKGEARRTETAGGALDRVAARDAVLRLLDKLAPEDAEILMMRYLDDLQYDEIAAITELAISTLRSRVHRSLKKLQAIHASTSPGPEVMSRGV